MYIICNPDGCNYMTVSAYHVVTIACGTYKKAKDELEFMMRDSDDIFTLKYLQGCKIYKVEEAMPTTI